MLDFIYYVPTKVVFGKDKAKEVGRILKDYGFSRVLLLYGGGSIKRSGLYGTVTEALKESGTAFAEKGGVEPNPKADFVREAIALAKETRAELILAVGGGSVIDAAKYTAIGAKDEGDILDFPMGRRTVKEALPVGTILTHAAAGSEMSASAVLSDLDTNMKRGIRGDFNRPLFSILDPTLTYTVSPYQTACGIVDMMMHTLERYFVDCPPTPLTDGLAESLLRSIIDAGRVAMREPENYEARATLMWASSLAHNDLTGAGRANSLAVHQLEHALSGAYDSVAHGAGLAVLFPAWMRYVYKYNLPRFASLARGVFGVSKEDDGRAALLGIEAMEDYFASIGMPRCLRALGVKKEDIPLLADLTTFGGSRVIHGVIDLDTEKIKEIFSLAY